MKVPKFIEAELKSEQESEPEPEPGLESDTKYK